MQSKTNKQARDYRDVPREVREKVIKYFDEFSSRNYAFYSELNKVGVARELARAILPVNLYMEGYWKSDLHNTLYFLQLRMDSHAQFEIRVYSNAMANIIKEIVRMAYDSFDDYVANGFSFSTSDQDIISKNLSDRFVEDMIDDVHYRITASLHKYKPRKKATDLHELYQERGRRDDSAVFGTKWNSGKIETGDVLEFREFKTNLEKYIRDNCEIYP